MLMLSCGFALYVAGALASSVTVATADALSHAFAAPMAAVASTVLLHTPNTGGRFRTFAKSCEILGALCVSEGLSH